jgi:uncharacterized protein (DUF433 family)
MALSIAKETVPLSADAEGVLRVGNTRVTLDVLVACFADGATAEEIVQRYPTLQLADVYQVIGYYLRHPSEVQAYLRQRRDQAEGIRRQNETRFDPSGVRDRLLARRASRG